MDDERPEVAIGHVVMHVSDERKSTEFYLKLGLRGSEEAVRPGFSILELLGGTHLFVIDDEGMKKGMPASRTGAKLPIPDWTEDFELMVRGKTRDDLEAYREGLINKGLEPGPIDEAPFGHYVFQIDDPDENTITVYSSHARSPV